MTSASGMARMTTDQVEPRELARLDRPRGPHTTLAVVADTHLTETAHGTLKMLHRTKQRLLTAVMDLRQLEPDGVIAAGDLTNDGTETQHSLAAELLSTVPAPLLVVPGNHDGRSDDTDTQTRGNAMGVGDHDGYPVTAGLGEATVLGLDSTIPGRIGGRLDPATALPVAESRAAGPDIAVVHHPIAPPPPPFRGVVDTDTHRIEQPAAAADTLTGAGIDLVVSAHLHWPSVTAYRGLSVVNAPSTASFPPSYLVLEIDPEGTTVSLVPLAGSSGIREAYNYATRDDVRGRAIERAVTHAEHDSPVSVPV